MICVEPSQDTWSLEGEYSSNTTWKLLPPNPKALTPDRRGDEATQGLVFGNSANATGKSSLVRTLDCCRAHTSRGLEKALKNNLDDIRDQPSDRIAVPGDATR